MPTITIGRHSLGYVYTSMAQDEDLWKCAKAADKWDVPDGTVLWLTKMEAPENGWLAVHAPDSCSTAEQVK